MEHPNSGNLDKGCRELSGQLAVAPSRIESPVQAPLTGGLDSHLPQEGGSLSPGG